MHTSLTIQFFCFHRTSFEIRAHTSARFRNMQLLEVGKLLKCPRGTVFCLNEIHYRAPLSMRESAFKTLVSHENKTPPRSVKVVTSQPQMEMTRFHLLQTNLKTSQNIPEPQGVTGFQRKRWKPDEREPGPVRWLHGLSGCHHVKTTLWSVYL